MDPRLAQAGKAYMDFWCNSWVAILGCTRDSWAAGNFKNIGLVTGILFARLELVSLLFVLFSNSKNLCGVGYYLCYLH